MSFKVLGEISTFLRQVYYSRGNELLEYLNNIYLPSIGCPNQLAIEFISHITNDDPKLFRKTFTDFIKMSKGAT